MAKEYSYKRYQLSLDESDIKQKQIIEYLEQYKAGKLRNAALVKLLLVALGEKIDIDALPQKSTAFVSNEARLKRIEKKLDTMVWNLINRHGFTEIEDDVEDENNSIETVLEENIISDNQVPGQMSFDDVDIDEPEEKETDIYLGANNASEDKMTSKIEDNSDYTTLETDEKAEEISKEKVASAFGMPSASKTFDSVEEEDFDDFEIPEEAMALAAAFCERLDKGDL